MPRRRSIEDWEIALVKAMLRRGEFSKTAIQAYFNRPDRLFNFGRVTNIEEGQLGGDIAAASDDELDEYLRNWNRQGVQPNEPTFGPLDQRTVARVIRVNRGAPLRIETDETISVEFKETFNVQQLPEYARTMAGFANNAGGYLVFGVRNGTRAVIGLTGQAFERRDVSDLSQRLSAMFQPVMAFEKATLEVEDHRLGIIYVHPSDQKPVICRHNQDRLTDGALFYRYPGETTTIRSGELHALLAARERLLLREFMHKAEQVADAGVRQASVLNHLTGEMTGRSGSLLIDEALLGKIGFIREGQFSETEGAPTLRVVGDVEVVDHNQIQPVQHVPMAVSIDRIVRAFVAQDNLPNPQEVIRHMADETVLWVPIFYFMRMAGITNEQAIELIKERPTTRAAARRKLVARIRDRSKYHIQPGPSTTPYRDQLLAYRAIDFDAVANAHHAVRAAQTLAPEEIDLGHVLDHLSRALAYVEKTRDQALWNHVRYSAAHVDACAFSEKARA